MTRGRYLLQLLAALVFLDGYENQTLTLSPNLKDFYLGDSFYLSCEIAAVGEVTFFHNDEIFQKLNQAYLKVPVIKVPVATSQHSGTYYCEINNVRSSDITIAVMDYYPKASLTLETGQPVMQLYGSVILKLDNEDDGVWEWKCFAHRGKMTKTVRLKLQEDSKSLDFQRSLLGVPETIFWCTNRNETQRSNLVTIKTSDKKVSMEIYFMPVVAGDGLTLRCLSWGMEKISHVVFYKDNKLLHNSTADTHRIPSVKQSDQGGYKCKATTINKNNLVSDVQDLYILEGAMRPVVSGIFGLFCSCPGCQLSSGLRYRWYKINKDGQSLRLSGNSQELKEGGMGTYACMIMWGSGRTLISKGYIYNPVKVIIIIITIIVVILVGMAVAVKAYRKLNQRTVPGPVYDEMRLKSQDEGGDRYDRLQKFGAQKESEYDTIHPAVPHGAKEGDYQPLEQAGMTEGVYHTLGMGREKGGAAMGGYETLQRNTMKEDIYHIIGMAGATGSGQK